MNSKFMKIALLACLCFRGAAIVHVGESKTNETITTSVRCGAEDITWQTKAKSRPFVPGTCNWFGCDGFNTCCLEQGSDYKCMCRANHVAALKKHCQPAAREDVDGTPERASWYAARRQAVETISVHYGLGQDLSWTAVKVDELLQAILTPMAPGTVADGEVTDVKFFSGAPGSAEAEIAKGLGTWKEGVLDPDRSYAKIYAKTTWKNQVVETATTVTVDMMASVSVGAEAKLGANELWETLAYMKFGAELGMKAKVDVNGITASMSSLVTADCEVAFANLPGISVAGTASAGGKLDFAAKFDWKNANMKLGGEAFVGFKAEGKINLRYIAFKASARFGAGVKAELKVEDGVAGAEIGATLGPGFTIGVDICFGQIYSDVASLITWDNSAENELYVAQYSDREELSKLPVHIKMRLAQAVMQKLPAPFSETLTTEQKAALTLALMSKSKADVDKALAQHREIAAQI